LVFDEIYADFKLVRDSLWISKDKSTQNPLEAAINMKLSTET